MTGLDLHAEIARAAGFLRAGRWREADRAIRCVLTAWPDWSEGLREIAGLALRLSGAAPAINALSRAVARAPDDARAWFLMARARYAARDVDGGWVAARRTTILQPGHQEAPSFLAALAFHRGDHRGASIALDRARCLRPLTDTDRRTRLLAYLELGLLSRADGLARRLLVTDPGEETALSALARARHRQRDTDLAWRLLRRLTVLRPTDTATLTAASRISLARRRLEEAESYARRALVAGATDGEGWLDLARPLWLREDFVAAERVMSRAALVDPAMALRCRILRLTVTPRDFKAAFYRNSVNTPV